MRKIIVYALLLMATLSLSSCNDWLDVLPNNEQVTDDYWKSKEDVEAVLASGYYYMREAVPTLISWGEVRGGTIYSTLGSDAKIQNFVVMPTDNICEYAGIYKIIGMANSVLKYAPSVMLEDDTYYEAVMNSHLAEAYFMRAYCYFTLVKNYRDVPLVIEAYVNDEAEYNIPKSTEAEIIAQIKKDITTALGTGAAKGSYEEEWQTKGRATKWALYALMADVCLWNHDYDECIIYCNEILNATDAFRPVFITNPYQWYEMFYPGNSNESIFELNWDNTTYAQTNNFGSRFAVGTSSIYKYTNVAIEKLKKETADVIAHSGASEGRLGRMYLASFVSTGAVEQANELYVWKYRGTDVVDINNVRLQEDANFIIYRVAEVMLMKAEALIMKGGEDAWKVALDLINSVRSRAMLGNLEIEVESTDEHELLMAVLDEREMEFSAEGKRWYDLLRFARYNEKYAEEFVNMVVNANQTYNKQWIRSVLQDENAWYLPIPYSEMEINSKLEQNPYYKTTK